MKDSEMPLPSKGPKSYTPLSMKEIFAKNTITREEYIAMVTAEQGEVKREIPPHVLALAKADPAPLPVSAEHWLGMKTGSRPWLVKQCARRRNTCSQDSHRQAPQLLLHRRLGKSAGSDRAVRVCPALWPRQPQKHHRVLGIQTSACHNRLWPFVGAAFRPDPGRPAGETR